MRTTAASSNRLTPEGYQRHFTNQHSRFDNHQSKDHGVALRERSPNGAPLWGLAHAVEAIERIWANAVRPARLRVRRSSMIGEAFAEKRSRPSESHRSLGFSAGGLPFARLIQHVADEADSRLTNFLNSLRYVLMSPALHRVLLALAGLLSIASVSRAQQSAPINPKNWQAVLTEQVKVVGDSDIQTVRRQALSSLAVLESELARQPSGGIWRRDLQLDLAAETLQQTRPDGSQLRRVASALRRTVPGAAQQSVDALREQIQTLAPWVTLSADRVGELQVAISQLAQYLDGATSALSADQQDDLRQAFAVLAHLHPSHRQVEQVRDLLAVPNHHTIVYRRYLDDMGRKSFTIPLEFAQQQGPMALQSQGQLQVNTRLEIPIEERGCALIVHVQGVGSLSVSAASPQLRLRANVNAPLRGAQTIGLRPEGIVAQDPQLRVCVKSTVAQVCPTGLLGRSRVAQRLTSRVAQRAMEAKDPQVSREVEMRVKDRIDDEGYELAYRVNTLLKSAFADRLQAIDVEPQLHLFNSVLGAECAANYSRYDQLGAVRSFAALPAGLQDQLDIVTWAHESIVNNLAERMAGMRLDEATMTGLWQEHLRLTSDEWTQLPRGRVPALITLADANPLEISLADQGVDIVLRVASCELDGVVQDRALRALRLRYNLLNEPAGLRLVRGEASAKPQADFPADKLAIWQTVLDRFFGRQMQPLPKFRNAAFPEHLQILYLDIQDGWLTAGVARTRIGDDDPTRVAAGGKL